MQKKKTGLRHEINMSDGTTTPAELIRETLVNFAWGFAGNSMTLFIAKEVDGAIFINFFVYYMILSYIINRAGYKTRLGKLIVLPGSAAAGAFAGYKFSQYISLFL